MNNVKCVINYVLYQLAARSFKVKWLRKAVYFYKLKIQKKTKNTDIITLINFWMNWANAQFLKCVLSNGVGRERGTGRGKLALRSSKASLTALQHNLPNMTLPGMKGIIMISFCFLWNYAGMKHLKRNCYFVKKKTIFFFLSL